MLSMSSARAFSGTNAATGSPDKKMSTKLSKLTANNTRTDCHTRRRMYPVTDPVILTGEHPSAQARPQSPSPSGQSRIRTSPPPAAPLEETTLHWHGSRAAMGESRHGLMANQGGGIDPMGTPPGNDDSLSQAAAAIASRNSLRMVSPAEVRQVCTRPSKSVNGRL